ncbi:ABC transporter permease [Bacillus sp. FJAT-45066]|uniref:ABC transporter permease n=1 Tax=Bacillus sp. FJAT-45066 TaxID=2011010 RepID=UPI0015964D21|nr:ABC transporter permease [Bacillus sp. FJAT-45066]
MFYRSKFLFLLRHIFQMSVKSNSRLFLSLLGLIIGLYIFSLSNIMLDSYYKGMFDQVEEMNETAIVAELSNENEELLKDIRVVQDNVSMEATASSSRPLIYYEKISDSAYHSITSTFVGVSSVQDVIPVFYENKYQIAADVTLLKGRLLSENDHALKNNVAIIDRFTEEMLFPDGDSIGKTVRINIEIPGMANVSTNQENEATKPHDLTVVGVIENMYNSTYSELQYKKGMKQKGDNMFTNVTIYTPLSILEEKLEVEDHTLFVWKFETMEQQTFAFHTLKSYQHIHTGQIEVFSIASYALLIENLTSTLKPIKTFINTLLILFLTISGVSVMSIMFFSIKERVPEIGIKKAYGANKLDILIQFILEGMLLALIGSVIAILLSIVTSLVIQQYLQESLFILFQLHLTIDKILVPFFVSGIFGFLFSLIPSYYGAKIPITNAIRFE